MGLLRLLTNPAVMGVDLLTARDAWRVYRTMLTDERIGFAPEPLTLEVAWRKLTMLDRPALKIWTDAYLAAFAQSAAMRLVTLGSGVACVGAAEPVLDSITGGQAVEVVAVVIAVLDGRTIERYTLAIQGGLTHEMLRTKRRVCLHDRRSLGSLLVARSAPGAGANLYRNASGHRNRFHRLGSAECTRVAG